MPSNSEKIDDFLSKGRTVIDHIMSIESNTAPPSTLREYKKLLIAAHIDGYSRLIYPRRAPRDRYVRFVERFAKWTDADRLSLIHLYELLRKSPDPEFENLRKDVMRRMALMNNCGGESDPTKLTKSPTSITNDPKISEIIRKWPQDKDLKEPLEGIIIDSLKHASLFYTYRCSLSHELIPPGFQWDVIEKDHPYYIHSGEMVGNEWKHGWVLIYPLGFFHLVASNCLSSLDTYLKSNDLDPYTMRSCGDFWLESLNE